MPSWHTMTGERGVLYVATGAAHIEAARRSATSVRATNPMLGIALFADQPVQAPEFDAVLPIRDPHKRSKVDHLGASPFAETLYLDSDTRVRDDLSDLFRVLERFELACALRENALSRHRRSRGDRDVPEAFPEYNCGVLLYRGTDRTRAFLEAWRHAYAAMGKAADQRSFRDTVWTSDLRIAVLTPRYNARRFDPAAWLLRGDRPVILHMNRFHPSKRRAIHALLDPIVGR
jgi:hypothetical protein